MEDMERIGSGGEREMDSATVHLWGRRHVGERGMCWLDELHGLVH